MLSFISETSEGEVTERVQECIIADILRDFC